MDLVSPPLPVPPPPQQPLPPPINNAPPQQPPPSHINHPHAAALARLRAQNQQRVNEIVYSSISILNNTCLGCVY